MPTITFMLNSRCTLLVCFWISYSSTLSVFYLYVNTKLTSCSNFIECSSIWPCKSRPYFPIFCLSSSSFFFWFIHHMNLTIIIYTVFLIHLGISMVVIMGQVVSDRLQKILLKDVGSLKAKMEKRREIIMKSKTNTAWS